MKKLRILYVIDSVAEAAGTENQLLEFLKRLDANRFELFLVCFENSPRLEEARRYATTCVFPIKAAYSPSGLRQIWALRRYIREHAIDVVHTFLVKGAIVGVLAGRGAAPVVITSRRSLGYWYTPKILMLFRFLNRHTTRVLANCDAVKRIVVDKEGVPASQVDVIYNGVDMRLFEASANAGMAASDIPEGVPVIGIVANYRPVKNLDMFLQGAALVSQQFPQAVFLLVGKGPLKDELAGLAERLGIRSKVYFTNGVGSVPALLRRMSIACLTSSSEGFSNAILEYMAAGLPVIATAVGGNAEAVVDGETGLIVPPGDPAAFAAAVCRLLGNEQERAQMAGHRQPLRGAFAAWRRQRNVSRCSVELLGLAPAC